MAEENKNPNAVNPGVNPEVPQPTTAGVPASSIDKAPAEIPPTSNPQVPPAPAPSIAETSTTTAPIVDPLVKNQQALEQQQKDQIDKLTAEFARGIGVSPTEVLDLSLPQIKNIVNKLDNATLSAYTKNTLITPADAELARREAILAIQQVQQEIKFLKSTPVGQSSAYTNELVAAERRLGASLQQVERATVRQVEQASVGGKETAVLTAGALLASGLLQAFSRNTQTSPAPVGNPPNPQIPSVPTPVVALSQVVTGNSTTVQDDAVSTGQGDPLSTLDTVVATNSNVLEVTPQPVPSQTVFFPDGRSLELAAGEFVDEAGFVVSDNDIRRFASDVAIDNEEDLVEDGLVEFTAGGQRIVDADNPDFVVTPGGLRVAAEDVDLEVDTEGSDLVRVPTDADIEEASFAQAALDRARQQASVSALRKANGKAVGDGDWRVRLRLAPNAYYLYKAETPGIMQPLQETDGVIFPYTPRIDMTYSADYNPTDLTHSNYRGYFYRGSKVGEIVMNADFTAQDTQEADYLLATIHFFRSCTKMFYGQDPDRGAPPPLVFLSGLGEFQFNEHPCVISQFNYNLPNDVDYIRSRGRQSTSAGVTQGGNGLMFRRTLTGSATSSYSLSSIIPRLLGANLPAGGVNIPPAPPNLGLNSPTYVPTKMNISLTLLPMPTRSQVSQQFSLEKYANGNALRGGFW
jgi:hypothetical protein